MTRSRRRYKKLKHKASRLRKRMISRNRRHPRRRRRFRNYSRLKKRMPSRYKQALEKVEKTSSGRKALARYRKFWGLEYPTSISQIDIPGVKKGETVVGMGTSPKVILADGPNKKSATRIRQVRGKRILATNTTGTRMYIVGKGKNSGKKRFVGWAPETHYVPTKAMEKAGTHKKGKYWVHLHNDDGGKWPKVFQAGNAFIYAPGTYRVTDWIRR
jgi:hypothetical protein